MLRKFLRAAMDQVAGKEFRSHRLSGRKRQRNLEKRAVPVEVLEQRTLLTVDLDQPFDIPGSPIAQVSERFDANASLDVIALAASGSLTVALNGGSGAWQSLETLNLGLTSGAGLTVGSVNHDSSADVVVQTRDSLAVAIGDGTGRFTLSQTLTPAMPGQLGRSNALPVGLVLSPLDGDYYSDLAVVVPGTSELLVYRGTSSGAFGSPARYSSGGREPVSVVSGQFVGGAEPDLAVAHGDGTIVLFEGDGSGGFAARSTISVPAVSGTGLSGGAGLSGIQSVAATDVNADAETDLVIAAGETAVIAVNTPDTLKTSPIVNGRFDQGLSGWNTQIVGHSGFQRPGSVTGTNGYARLTEHESFLTSLQQTFTIPTAPQTISFDLRALELQSSGTGIPDAFEVSLLGSGGQSLVATHHSNATSFFNAGADGLVAMAPGVSRSGTTVTVDISAIAAGTQATLIFDLVGNPPETESTVVVDNVVIVPDHVADNSFSLVPLPGTFIDAAGIATGDVNGDARTDILLTDRSAGELLVFEQTGSISYVRSSVDLRAFGAEPVSVITADLIPGEGDDVAVGLFGSNRVLSPLLTDTTAPAALLISPQPDFVNAHTGRQLVVQFSEPMRVTGSAGNNSVTALAAWQLTEAGLDGLFGTTDDVLLPLVSVTWSSGSNQATAAFAADLTDGHYQLTLEADHPQIGMTDLSGNRLNHGQDVVFAFTVNSDGPSISTLNAITASEGESQFLVATVSDPGGQGPWQATVHWGDGTTETVPLSMPGGFGSLVLPHVWAQDGSYAVTVTVVDGASVAATQTTTADVNNALPALDAVAPLAVIEGHPATLSVILTDPGVQDSHTASIAWGDGTTSVGLVVFANGTGTVSGTHAYADNGTWLITITVEDDGGSSAAQTTSAVVVNATPVLTEISSIVGSEGTEISVVATFSDPGRLDTHSAVIHWSDGTSSAGLVTESGGTGTITGTHIYGDDGSFTVSIELTDSDGDQTVASAAAVIQNVVPVVTPVIVPALEAGVLQSVVVATFSDPGFITNGAEEEFTAVIDWGDGTISSGSVSTVPGAAGVPTTGTVSGSHTYLSSGTFLLVVTVTDDDGASQIVHSTVVVRPVDAPPVPGTVFVSPADEGESVGLTLDFADPGDPGPHTAWISWGDGTISGGTVSFAAGLGTVTGAHTYADDGSWRVSVRIIDSSAMESVSTGLANIQNTVPQVFPGAPQTRILGFPVFGILAIFSDAGFSDALRAASETFTATIHWGDGSTDSGELVVSNGSDGQPTTGTVSGSHFYSAVGTYSVFITVTDDDGGVGTATLQVAIDPPPDPPVITGAGIVNEGSVYALNLDSNGYMPLAWNIDWGDGSPVETVPGNSNLVLHTYADDQETAIRATVLGSDRLVAAEPLLVTVVNVAPEVSVQGLSTVGVGQTYTLTWSAIDPGQDSISSWSIHWGDGTTTVVAGNFSTATHVYAAAASVSVVVYANDEDGSFSAAPKPLTIVAVEGNKPRFFVVDSQSDRTYRYDAAGAPVGAFGLGASNNVRGVTTTGAGNPIWTVDNDDRVYVYDSASGAMLGSWTAGTINNPEDLATNGTDVWILDRADDRIYQYPGAASRRSGFQAPSTGFALHRDNRDGYGLATDGTWFWVVDKNARAVFVYTVASGAYVGRWTIDAANSQPTGITLDPSGGTDLWIVDRQTNAVYRYEQARSRISGSQNAADIFALSPGNVRPEGIADPTFPYTLNSVIISSISVPGEIDDYQFTATAGQRIYLDVQLVQSATLVASIIRPDGSTLISYTMSASTANPDETNGNFLLTQSGTYTMRLSSPSGGTPNYQVVTNDVTLPDQATAIYDVPLSGRVDRAGGTDEWLITATAGQGLWIQQNFSSTFTMPASLYAPSGALVFSGSRPNFGPTVVSETGVYRLVIDPIFDDTSSYTITVRDTTPVIRSLQIGDSVTSTISRPQARDIWRFAGTATQSVYLDFQSVTDNGVLYELVRPNGTVLTNGGNLSASLLDNGPVTLDQTGTWEFRVWGPSTTLPTYRFQIWDVPAPDVLSVIPGELMLGSIETPGRKDIFEIQGFSGQQVYVDFQENNLWVEWELRRPDNTLIQSASSFLISQLDSVPITLPVAGTYQLTVRGRGDGAGDFQLRVFDITPPAAPTPILYDQIVTGSLLLPGQTPSYSFAGTTATPLMLDVLFNDASSLAWTLVAPSGATVFANSAVDRSVASLPESGTYRLFVDQLNGAATDTTGQYSFRIVNPSVTPPLPPPADLVVSSVVRPNSAIGTAVTFDVTWTVTNTGTGSTTVPSWSDRIYLSADNTFRRAVERMAGEFTFNGALAPGASYTRTETIRIPDGYSGDLTVIVETDARNQVFELLNEANNTLTLLPTAIHLAALPDGPPAIVLNVTDGQKFPAGSSVSLAGLATALPATANIVFAVDLSDSTRANPGSDANFDGVSNAADDLNGDGSAGDINDVEIGALLRVVQSLRDNQINAMVSIVAFASFAEHMDLSPAVFRQTFASPTADVNGNGIFDIDEAALSMRPTSVGKFRPFEVSIGTNFDTTSALITQVLDRALPAQKTQVLFLTDGAASAPPPAVLNSMAAHDIDFFGFQISGSSISSSLQFMANTIDAHPVSTGRTQLISDPEDLGAALLQSLRITRVQVDGSDVQALDVAGNFFTSVTIQEGPNPFVVTATDSAGRTTSTGVTLIGIDPATFAPSQTQSISHQADVSWSGTTFNRLTRTLHADLAVTNTAVTVLDAPVLAVFESLGSPSVTVSSAEGTTGDSGRPFVRFDSEFPSQMLSSGQKSAAIPVDFRNFVFSRFNPDISLQALGNRAPWFTSVPSTSATTDVLYSTLLTAVDPDGHSLSYELTRGPAGMRVVSSVSGSGTPLVNLEWTPSLLHAGIHDVEVRVSDGRGGSAIQSWQLGVSEPVPLPNLAPWFRTEPITAGSVGTQYSYVPSAFDPEGLNVTYQLVSGPTGLELVTIGTTSLGAPVRALRWTPGAADIGQHTVQLKASDPAGRSAFQEWTLRVKGPNTPPVITTIPSESVTAGGIYRFDADAVDAEDAVSFELAGAPAGLLFDAVTGQIVWQTSVADIGSYPLTLRAIDERGASATLSFTLTVSADVTGPEVTVSLSPNVVNPGESVTITVNATDNVAVAGRTLLVNGVPLTLDSSNRAVFQAVTPGLFTVSAAAVDAQGNSGFATATLRVTDPTDLTPPVILVTSPRPADVVTWLTEITGSIIDDHLESYSVAWSPLFADQWTTFATTTFPNADGRLSSSAIAVFDPTLLQNDAYDVRITATDLSGNISTYQFELSVEGQAKIGNFEIEFTDLTIPLAGIPITISRSYDTLRAAESGDFGHGWTLALAESRIRETRPVREQESLFNNFAFRAGTRVYLDSPSGRRIGFTFDPIAEATLLGTQFYPRFTADPGVFERLDVEQVPLRQNPDGTFKLYFGAFDYNPQVYTLITKDQLRYTYDQFAGLLSISNRSNVSLTYTSSGIFSSVGESITWTRDDFGRITEILDPQGNTIQYAYDAAGDLVSVTNQAGEATTLAYLSARPHFLSQVIDSLGHLDFQAAFDADGRLQAIGDAFGNSTRHTYDLADNQEFVADRLGNESKITYDHRGNVIATTNPLGSTLTMTYDANDNLLSSTDSLGRTTAYAWGQSGNMEQITDAAGGVWSMSYTADNDLSTRIDPLGRVTSRQYDLNGNLTLITDPLGHSTSFAYDLAGRAVSMTADHGEITRYLYSTAGSQPTQIVHPDGATRSVTYNMWGDMTSFTNERGFTSFSEYDSLGRPTRTTDALGGVARLLWNGPRLISTIDQLGRVTRYEYDDKDRRTREIDPAGGVRQIVYDANDTVVSIIDENGHASSASIRADGLVEAITNPLGHVVGYGYDIAGRQVSMTDERGFTTQFAYDELDRVTRMTDAMGNVWEAAWDAVGNRTATTDPLGRVTTQVYDELNRVIETVDAAGSVWKRSWDDHSNLLSSTDARGRTTRYEYDERHRLIRTIDAAGFSYSMNYDSAGNLSSVVDQLGNVTTHQYDALNRLTSTLDVFGGSTSRSYDVVGNLLSVTDPNGRTSHFSWDELDRQTSVINPRGGITSISYDAVGNLVTHTDPLRNVTTYEYDASDQLIRRTDPLGAATTWQYDAAGNTIQYSDRLGRVADSRFDALNRKVEETWRAGSNVRNHASFEYDAAGNLLSAQDTFSQYTFTYDSLNRVVSSDNSGTPGAVPLVLNYTWDAVGNQTEVRDQYGVSVTSRFDERDLLVGRTWSGSGSTTAVSAYAAMVRDARGVQTAIQRYSDADGTQPVSRSEFSIDGKARLTGITHFDASGAIFADLDLYFDDADQLIGRDLNNARSDYRYDESGQLISAEHADLPAESWEYDANGNRIGPGRTTGTGNRLQSDGEYSWDWDAEGNIRSRTRLSDGTVIRYSWDHRNRLTRVTEETSAGIVTESTEFTYDVFDRRISRTIDEDGTGPEPSSTSTFAFNDDHVWFDGDNSGAITARYLFGDSVDDLLARYRTTDGLAWYLTDQIGSVMAIVDSTGTVIDQLVYDSFGNLLSETAPAAGDRFKFTGRELDQETGLLYYRARYYDSSIGQFLSEDPLSFSAGDTNLTRYVGNSPIAFNDPFGLTASFDTVSFADIATRAAASVASGVFGFACGYIEATMAGEKNPFQAALNDAVTGATIGAVVGGAMSFLPGQLQMFAGIVMAVQGITDADTLQLAILRGACIAVEFGIGASADRTRDFFDGLFPSKRNFEPPVVHPKSAPQADPPVAKLQYPDKLDPNKDYVIGRTKDLETPGVLRENESLLPFHMVRKPDGAVDVGATYWENHKALREVIKLRKPIRDVSDIKDRNGAFLNGERELLRHHGWEHDLESGYWYPPKGKGS